ncbi:hypothetical protein PS659_01584 [Pseudomonas fluorescens]|jgi:hypothetical protein|uniref:Uncharacterized protein n=1 Tax=Pseudomonas fluorescens TaxID=294 RepID=A0A5E6REE3_PSEFL|nr:hypothetical protein PS659_01584 [Pseudomonas fluorescens]
MLVTSNNVMGIVSGSMPKAFESKDGEHFKNPVFSGP